MPGIDTEPAAPKVGYFAALRNEWPMIFAAPRTATTFLVAAIAVIWAVTHWEYHGVLDSKDEQIKSKEEQLKTKNGDLLLKDDQIKFVERQRDDYKEKLGGATPSEAKDRITELENQLKSLEPRVVNLEPRRITEEQSHNITSNVALPAGLNYNLSIAHDGNCIDCNAYATAISAAFHMAGGWNIQQPMVLGVSHASPYGVLIREHGSQQAEVSIIVRALNAAKIRFSQDTIPPLPTGIPVEIASVEIVVTPVIK